MSSVYIRDESAENERRTPLVPKYIVRLIEKGIEVFVQSSETRIYSDEQYTNAGAKITNKPWYTYQDVLIIGIKELTNLEKLNNHTHMYFSHSYKNQTNSKLILDAFRVSNSRLYDFEYFVNNQNQRLIAFGFHAGIVGAILGLRQYTNHLTSAPDLENLTVFSDINNLLKAFYKITSRHVNIAIVGANGRCGSGVKYILEGHSYKTEGVSPLGYNYIDGGYVKSVQKEFGTHKIKTYPLMDFTSFLKWVVLKKIKKIRPFWYIKYNKEEAQAFLQKEFDWQYYGGHHLENRMTAFWEPLVGVVLLQEKKH